MSGPTVTSATEILADGNWLAHRYREADDAILFRWFPRERHRAVTFLSEEEVGEGPVVALPRQACLEQAVGKAVPPPHLILHSAFCCSTLLARAMDVPAIAMGLSEPMILNDAAGLALRGVDRRQVVAALDAGLRLLGRPLAPGEQVVVKPTNLINPFLPAMLSLNPDVRLLLLHAPLEDYLGSIARKGTEGAAWVRELMWKLIRLGQAARFGLSEEELYRQTDLQVAALGWLAQQGIFLDAIGAAKGRVRTLDSDTLTDRTVEVVAALSRHFDIALDAPAIAAGPAFTRHSKDGRVFDQEARRAERDRGLQLHAREIAMVMEWSRRMADFAGIPLTLPQPLVG